MSGFGGIGCIIYQPIHWSFTDKGLYNSHHGLRQAYRPKRCIEVTNGSEESFVGVLDRPK